MPGPPPKPTALRELEGRNTKPSERRKPEPKPESPLYPPGDLSGEALAEWGRMVPELSRLGLATGVDRAALIAYCEAYGTFDEARRVVREKGVLTRGRDGGHVKNPAFQIMRDAADMMLKYGGRFGFTPADRVRLQGLGDSGDDGEDAAVLSLLSGG